MINTRILSLEYLFDVGLNFEGNFDGGLVFCVKNAIWLRLRMDFVMMFYSYLYVVT